MILYAELEVSYPKVSINVADTDTELNCLSDPIS